MSLSITSSLHDSCILQKGGTLFPSFKAHASPFLAFAISSLMFILVTSSFTAEDIISAKSSPVFVLFAFGGRLMSVTVSVKSMSSSSKLSFSKTSWVQGISSVFFSAYLLSFKLLICSFFLESGYLAATSDETKKRVRNFSPWN
jgi:hypothetical protein